MILLKGGEVKVVAKDLVCPDCGEPMEECSCPGSPYCPDCGGRAEAALRRCHDCLAELGGG